MGGQSHTNIRVSVLIPTYNYGRFICQALESVFNQDIPSESLEVVVVDDGSTDDTDKKIHDYRDRIKYIYKKNQGFASSLNTGVQNASGEIIALLDADDYWYPGKLSKVVKAFSSFNDVDVVYDYMRHVDQNGKVIGVRPLKHQQPVFEHTPRQSYLKGVIPFSPPTSAISIRKTCYEKMGPVPSDVLAPDLYIRYLLPLYARRFQLIREHLTAYRFHGANFWAGKKVEEYAIREIKMLQQMRAYVHQHVQRLGYDSSLLERCFHTKIAWERIQLYKVQGRKKEAMREVFLLKEFPAPGRFAYRVFRKVSLFLSVLLPTWLYGGMKNLYQTTGMVKIVHMLIR